MPETLSFYLSKIGWMVLAPSHFLVLLLLISFFQSRLLARVFLQGAVALILLLCTVFPIGDWILLPLEQCFAERLPFAGTPNGYVVLGGAVDARISSARSNITFTNAADRVVQMAKIINTNPQMPVIYTGGSGAMFYQKFDEATAVKTFLSEAGFKTDAFFMEGASRNTYENAINSVKMMGKTPGQNWILLSSAYHLPRAMALFEKAGAPDKISFHPMPVDYKTIGTLKFGVDFDLVGSLSKIDIAAKEYLGLFLNKFLGKADTSWPCDEAKKAGLL